MCECVLIWLMSVIILHVTSGHMAVYGPVRHQKNIIWTSEASVHIIFCWWWTGPYIYTFICCHMTLSAMNYLQYIYKKIKIKLVCTGKVLLFIECQFWWILCFSKTTKYNVRRNTKFQYYYLYIHQVRKLWIIMLLPKTEP
jgi:hypothetical protein